jgi:hypothetical protein
MLTRETKFFLSMMTSICFGRDYRMTLQNRSTPVGARPCPSIALSGKFAILFLQFSNWSTPSLSFALLLLPETRYRWLVRQDFCKWRKNGSWDIK